MFGITSTVAKAPVGQRRCVLAQASPDRRAIVTGFVAGIAALSSGQALAADSTPVDLFDDRKRTAKSTGFDLIYEARDLDLPQSTRDGIDQFRGDLSATKARFQEASKRIQGPLGTYVGKAYWTEAKEELRNQVGNFRQDLKTLVSVKGSKAERKEGTAKAKALIVACEELDFAIRSKDQAKADKLYAEVKDQLKAFSSFALA